MKCKIVALLLVLSLLLTSCSWLDGNYVSVTPHREQRQEGLMQIVSASELQELLEALKDMGMPEVDWFLQRFGSSFGLTLDELRRR